MVTWRTELHFICDQLDDYNPNCHKELSLDQLDAKTKGGMLRIAKKEGWVWDKNKCYCPACKEKYWK